MPELKLPDLHLPEAGLYLTAVMFYPRDPAKHAAFVEAARNDAVRRVMHRMRSANVDPASRSPEAIRLMADAATGPSIGGETRAGHLVAKNYRRTEIAALMFLYVLACDDAPEEGEKATLDHARDTISTAGVIAGQMPGLSRTYVIKIWNDFSPAVHLLAAMTFLPDLWRVAGESGNGTRLAEFLAVAEAMRIRGETHFSDHAGTPLLDPAKTWTVPARFILPEVSLAGIPKPSALKAWMAESRRVQKSLKKTG